MLLAGGDFPNRVARLVVTGSPNAPPSCIVLRFEQALRLNAFDQLPGDN